MIMAAMISGKLIVINKPFCCIPKSSTVIGEKKLMITTDIRLKKIIRGMEHKIVRMIFFGSINTIQPSANKYLFFLHYILEIYFVPSKESPF
jgi:hypothetical protein